MAVKPNLPGITTHTVETEQHTNDDGSETYSNSFSTEGFSGGAFDYLYELSTGYPQSSVILDMVHPKTMVSKKAANDEPQIYITRISGYNPYYIKTNATSLDGKRGYSTAVRIDKVHREKMWGGSGYSSLRGAKLDSVPGTILTNCVGYVNARSQEVWNLALKKGFLVWDGDKYIIPSQNNREVPAFKGVPNCNAYSFNSKSIYNGNTPGYGKGKTPVPGAIACWRKRTDPNGQPGHVGFVEAVYNVGQADEYIVTSESGYCKSGPQYVGWTKKIYKKDDYACGTGPLANFLYSPVCYLASNGTGLGGGSVTVADPTHLTEEEEEALNKLLEQWTGKTVLKAIKPGSKVEIQWFGNTSPDGGGKRINRGGVIAMVLARNKEKLYPYVLTVNNVVIGYYQRTSIKLIDGEEEDYVEETSEAD